MYVLTNCGVCSISKLYIHMIICVFYVPVCVRMYVCTYVSRGGCLNTLVKKHN
jgi:hypothetical protein